MADTADCLDCGRNTLNGVDYYMVHERAWMQAVNYEERHGMLCWDCLEKRLKRKITHKDLTQCPLNTEINPRAQKLLTEAKQSS